MKARMVAVVAVDDAVEHAGGVARALLRQFRAALEQDRGSAALRQSERRRAAGEPAADDGDRQAVRSRRRTRPRARAAGADSAAA